MFTIKQTRAMKHARRLYDVVLEFIRQCPWSDLHHALVLAWMVIGLIESGRSNLTHWIKSVETGAVYTQPGKILNG